MRKVSFDRGFIAGTLWGASAIFLIGSGYFLSEFNTENFSLISFIISCVMGVALSIGSFKALKSFN
ncbi:hypothetical protein MTsN2n4_39540 [Pseudoalteromonas sp. MTN2-4]